MMRTTIPLWITGVIGFVMVAAHFVPYAEQWGDTINMWFEVLAAFAFILGGGNLLGAHLRKLSDRKPGWGYSAVIILSFFATLIVGMGKFGVLPKTQYPSQAWSGYYVETGSGLWWIYTFIYSPLAATIFALLAFYIASAAFRAFRAKNIEASILLATAVLVLLGRTYAGVILTDWIPYESLRIGNIVDWILSVFNTAGMRAIKIGIALGIVSTSLKILLGIDRSYLGSD